MWPLSLADVTPARRYEINAESLSPRVERAHHSMKIPPFHQSIPPLQWNRPLQKPLATPIDTNPSQQQQVVIINIQEAGTKSHPFGHALVAGIERYPAGVTRRMSKKRQDKRSKVKPFIKTVNFNHVMPTRYILELEGLKNAVTNDTFKEVSQREDAKKNVKKAMEERYQTGKNKWFFTPLSMCLLQSQTLFRVGLGEEVMDKLI